MVVAECSRRVRSSAPVDLGLTFGPLVRGRFDPASRFDRGAWWRAWTTPGGPVTTCIGVDRSDGAIDVRAWGAGAPWAIEHAPAIVGADVDLADAHAVLQRDAFVAGALHTCDGLRVVRLGAVYDVTLGTVLEQRVTTIESRRQWARLVRRFGTRAPGPVLDLMLAPAPSAVAALADHTRHAMGVEWRRGSTLARVAAEVCRLDRAAALPGDALARRLRALRGVGPWTEAHVLHYVQGDPDAVPVGDWHLPSIVTYSLAGERRGDDARMLELLEPFRPYRALALRVIAASGGRASRRVPRARIEDFVVRERVRA